MYANLRTDPRIKQALKNCLLAFLYEPVKKQLLQKINGIIIRNSLLGGYTHKSFDHRGISYSCDHTPAPRKANRVLPQVLPLLEEHLKEVNQLYNMEIPYVSGYITKVLNLSDNSQDYLQLLPESLHSTVIKLVGVDQYQPRKLDGVVVEQFLEHNQESISLIKQRMVRNLLM